ncbi:hypothetical protein HYDPIDRAFT_186955 [Hydnomerulius pinastri MD-312]|nr:hypothetical protein HYDPIDRAFT_186955 [Hydnomerulius pinastri MD-312]
MPLTQETLNPLVSTSYPLSYLLDHQFKTSATCYTPKSRSGSNSNKGISCTLLFAGGVSLNQELYLPLIKELFRLADESPAVNIRSAWVIERPNHGDAGVLNEETLIKHYVDQSFPGRLYGAAIRAFLESDLLSASDRVNLVGIAHSGGGGSILQAMEPAMKDLPLSRLVLVESPHVGHEAANNFLGLYDIVKTSNKRRPTRWATKEDAMNWFKTHLPCKTFHPDVWHVMSETYFRPDPEHQGMITTKTRIDQETACFLDDGTNYNAFTYLRRILNVLPIHLVVGDVLNIWPREINKMIAKNIEQDRPALASVTTIHGGGHYLPVQMPVEMAAEIFRILSGSASLSACRL